MPASSAPAPSSEPERGRGRLAGVWALAWAGCAGLWLCLDDTTALPELIDGAVAAGIAASGVTWVYAQRVVELRFRVRWSLRLWRPAVKSVSDLPLLITVLVRALAGGERAAGALRTVPFEPAGGPAEQDARRAAAIVAGSFPPNTIVLDIDPGGGTMLVHQLVVKPDDRDGVDPLRLG